MYWHDNIAGLANVLAACASAGVRDVVFSSSAAVYGVPDVDLVTEDLAPQPINPYGATKYVGEWMLADAERAHGMRTVALRYFNVAGAGWPELADTAVMNLVPIVLDRLEQGKAPIVFGDDYDTPDGTCIRDYVHVLDLAHAHIAALDYLRGEERPHRTFNVGTGEGSSVLEVIEAIARELDVVISMDTSTPAVMREGARAGAGLINDVRSLRRPGALETAAATDLAICLMHMRGEPGTMQQAPVYADVAGEVGAFLAEQVARCEAVGISRQRLVLDPGYGFAKTLEHNLELFRRQAELLAFGLPLLVGVSRKSMIGAVTGRPVEGRLAGGLALAALALVKGAQILRVHDVAETVDVVKMITAVEGFRQEQN